MDPAPPAGAPDCDTIAPTARLAGMIAAHAIWSVSDGETLITLVGREASGGERVIDRFVTERIEDSVARGREQLNANPHRDARAALAFDGYITVADGKTDAVWVEARAYEASGALPFEIGIPYRHAKSPNGFAVYRPKLAKVPPGLESCASTLPAFWEGVDSHAKAAAVWNAHIDQTR